MQKEGLKSGLNTSETDYKESSMDLTLFEERISEIEAYIELLEALNKQAQMGPPEIGGSVITAQQQKMLYGSVYLQLYNLVEATATWCLSAVSEATTRSNLWKPCQLDEMIQREWIRTKARTHVELSQQNRLDCAFQLCSHILQEMPVSDWEIEKGGGGNWDITALETISSRIGCDLNIESSVYTAAKRYFRNEKNSLEFIKDLRNQLAHGSISFEQSGENVTVSDLKELKTRTVEYLREVVRSFQNYLDGYHFLALSFRPEVGG